MKTKHLNRFIGFAFFMALAFVGFAQNEVIRIKSKGTIIDYDTRKKLENVQVIVMRNGSQQEVHDAGSSGKFDFTLPLGYTYDLKFSRADYVTKIIRIDTRNIPEEDRAGGFSMEFEASLFKYVEGFNVDILKEPMGKASFDSQTNYISFDFPYTEKMQKKVDDEFKRLKNLQQDGDRMRKDFDKYMAAGDERMGGQRYQEAMDQYKSALGIFPNDETAKSKYAEAERLYKEQLNAKNDQDRYAKLIKQGDDAFKGEKWEDAKAAYSEASGLRKDERYPKDQLYEIDKKLRELKDKADYDAAIAQGDEHFKDENFEAAIKSYEDALAIRKNEAYPKDQIDKARAELEKLASNKARQEELERNYNALVKAGDELFGGKRYAECISKYQEAYDMKPTIAYPNTQIEKAKALMRQATAMDGGGNKPPATDPNLEKYSKLMTEANNLYAQSNLTNEDLLKNAKEKYSSASALMPNEKLPKSQIVKIDDLLAALANASHDESASMRDQRIAQENEILEIRRQKTTEAREKVIGEQETKAQELDQLIAERQQWESQRKQTHQVQINLEAEASVESFYRDAADISRKGELNKITTQGENFDTQHLNNIGRNGDRITMQTPLDVYGTGTERPTLSEIDNSSIEKQAYAQKEHLNTIEHAQSEGDYRVQQANEQKNKRAEVVESKKTQTEATATQENSFHNENKKEAQFQIMEVDKQGQDLFERERQRAMQRQNQLERHIMETNTRSETYNTNDINIWGSAHTSMVNHSAEIDQKLANEMYKGVTPSEEDNSNIQEGVTERSYELTNPSRKVIERTVKTGRRVNVYQKIVSTTGILYTKDNTPITEDIWNLETTSSR